MELKAQNPNPLGSDLCVLVEMRGVEPLSERPTPRASTSVVCVFFSSVALPQTGLQLTSQVSFLFRYPTLTKQ